MLTNQTPCKDCSERFIACSDHCPKDERGEYGYKAYNADLYKVNKARKEYKRKRYEDYAHSEEKESYIQKYVSSKRGRNIWKDR